MPPVAIDLWHLNSMLAPANSRVASDRAARVRLAPVALPDLQNAHFLSTHPEIQGEVKNKKSRTHNFPAAA